MLVLNMIAEKSCSSLTFEKMQSSPHLSIIQGKKIIAKGGSVETLVVSFHIH